MELTNRYPYMYRSLVVNNKDPEKKGRVMVWVPDIMPDIPKDQGIWARPANNPVGGRNNEEDSEHHFMGSCYIPKKGSWTFVFFELGNPNRPYYFGALDIENTTVLAENRVGTNYEDKWTIFKSHDGRCVVVSDDDDDERIEITGKKRQISEPPSGDEDSVYNIDSNQTTILLDERSGKEKVLIRTHKGDFFHIDIDEQQLHAYFKDEIHIKTDSKLFIKAADEIHIKSDKKMYLESGEELYIKTSKSSYFESTENTNIKATGDLFLSGSNIHIKGTSSIVQDSGGKLSLKSSGAMTREALGDITDKSLKNIKREALSGISDKALTQHKVEAGAMASMLAGGLASIAGSGVALMGGGLPGDPVSTPAETATSATSSQSATDANPVGERNT